MKNWKKIGLGVLVALCIPFLVFGFEVKSGNSVYVAQDQTVEGNLYAAGSNVTVDGKVTGDVICAGGSVIINGGVEGDVICLGQSVNIRGPVGGSVRTAGNTIDIDSAIARNLNAFGANVVVEKNANIGREALIAGGFSQVSGKIGQSLLGAGGNFIISGEVGNDAQLYLGQGSDLKSNLVLTDSAKIGGNLNYTDKEKADIAQGAQIGGETIQNAPKVEKTKQNAGKAFATFWKWSLLYSMLSSFVVGLILILLMKEKLNLLLDLATEKIWPSIGWGILIMIVVPVLAGIVLFTIIGIPLALIILVLWMIALYLSHVVFSLLLGRSIMKNIFSRENPSLAWSLAVGIVIFELIVFIPFLGILVGLAAMWWSLGAMSVYFKKYNF